MTISMRRNNYDPDDNNCQHAGLFLDRGFKEWTDNHNADIVALHKQAAKIAPSPLYQAAYKQWRKQQLKNLENSTIWFGRLENRLFLGMGETSPLEAGITLHHTYGVPYIPGSAIKGVLHHYAQEAGVSEEVQDILFGKESSQTDKRDSGESGYIIFNNAWWIPDAGIKPLTPEIITVHHQDYYSSKGEKPSTDFDSPNPNPQIAIQGSFMFTLEGESKWIKYAIQLLKQALENKGIGAKSSSGYGYFTEDEKQNKHLEKDRIEVGASEADGIAKIEFIVKGLSEKQAKESLSSKRNPTLKHIHQQCGCFSEEHWDEYLNHIKKKFPDEIRSWAESSDKNMKKAHAALTKTWEPDYDKFS